MKAIKLMLFVSVLALVTLTAISTSQDSWDLGSSGDWLSTGPVYYNGPFYYPNSDLAIGNQRFLNNYPGYVPFRYPNTYPNYNPVVLGGIGNYTTPSYYQPGYYSPYYYDPQYQLDLASAIHANQKFLNNYYSRYYAAYYYPYWEGV